MHYQDGPHAHSKLVSCLSGRILDVVIDVRPQSDTFNQPYAVELDSNSGHALFIPEGFAHGFLSLENDTLMSYLTSTVHAPSHDRGVLWSSIDFDWPIERPLLSERDQKHPPIASLV